jgi:cytochrome c peroxidase
MSTRGTLIAVAMILAAVAAGCQDASRTTSSPETVALTTSADPAALDAANPIVPLPAPPLGIEGVLAELADPPTPEKVRLGRWLFFDPRLSADDTVSCATCHRPDHGFSEPTPVSTGVDGKKGNRKAPPVLNAAFDIEPHRFWDGRAASLEEQAIGPMVNPVEMSMPDHDFVVNKVRAIEGYRPYFAEAFGDDGIDIERIGKALADYERTRFSGNSPWDRWQAEPDPADASIDVEAVIDFEGNVNLDELELVDGKHVNAQVKLGHYVFFEKALCNQCHLGPNFTDAQFHNLGVGWDPEANALKDQGRFDATGNDADRGAFKTPTLREVSSRAPYMHDGSVATLQEVVALYDRGGDANPWLSPKITKIGLTETESAALVAFMEALSGEGYQDAPPAIFPE